MPACTAHRLLFTAIRAVLIVRADMCYMQSEHDAGSQDASSMYVRLLLNQDTQRIACLPGTAQPAAAPIQPPNAPPGAQTPQTPTSKQRKSQASPGEPSPSAQADARSPAPQPSSSKTGKQPQEPSGTSLEWLLHTVAESAPDSLQRSMLCLLVASHWHRRSFCEGAVSVVPLLGRRILLQV